jgi:choline monooxygenase
VLEPHPTFASQYARIRERPRALTYEARGEVERGQFHLLWPNLKLNVFPGQPNLSIGPVYPEGPERTAGYLDYFFGEGVDEEWIADLLALDEQVGREDTALVESVHRGMRSGLVDHGRLLLESEQLIHAFQRWLVTELG